MASSEAAAAIAPYVRYFSRSPDAVAADLDRFCQLLTQWQTVKNLVSRGTFGDLWTRHIADSLQLLKLLAPGDRSLIDLGSGGGFPAVPLAIARLGQAHLFTLVEPNARKASFLRTVGRELALPLAVLTARAGEIDSRETLPADVVTSRAMASLSLLYQAAFPFFGPTTRGLFHKGREYATELAETRALWDCDVILVQSDTDAAAVILEVRNLRPKTK